VQKHDSHYRVASTEQLIAINDAAILAEYNRALDPDELARLADPDGLHVLEPLLIHEHKNGLPTDPHWRCRVLIKVKGSDDPQVGYLDVSFDRLSLLETLPLRQGLHREG
jgi:hypothetical protein